MYRETIDVNVDFPVVFPAVMVDGKPQVGQGQQDRKEALVVHGTRLGAFGD